MQFGLVTGNLDCVRQAASWGFDYVEIMGLRLVPTEPDDAWHPRRRELEDAGARITHLAGFIGREARFVGPEVDWKRTQDYVETIVGRGAEIGVRVFNWGSPQSKSVPEGWPLSRAFEQIERAASLIADTVGRHGATCVIEPINPTECNVISYVTDGVTLARSVNRPEIRCLADFFHMSEQCEPLRHLDAARGLLGHAHTSGPMRLFPADGQPWDQRRYLGALKRIGYDATLSIESWTVPEGSTFPEDARASVAYLRGLWGEVPAAPDPAPEQFARWPP